MSGLRPALDSEVPRSLAGFDFAELGAVAAAGLDSEELGAEAGCDPLAVAGRGCEGGAGLLPASSVELGVLDDGDFVA